MFTSKDNEEGMATTSINVKYRDKDELIQHKD